MPNDNAINLDRGDNNGESAGLNARVEGQSAELGVGLAAFEGQNAQLEAALRARDEAQAQLESELRDFQLLHSVSSMLIDEDNVDALYQKLVEVATTIMKSDFGSMQRYDEKRGELQFIGHKGLDEKSIEYWRWVRPGQATTCGKALELRQRVIVSNFEACDFLKGSPDLTEFRKANVRSAQSTPLITRGGRLVGMITTHWTRQTEPSARDFRLLDIVARQAADLIERNMVLEALRLQADRLVEADRHKNEFIATLAHELRNPLAPIRNGVAVLKIGNADQTPSVLAMMDRQLSQMVRLIDDLLDVSRMSRGDIEVKRELVDLASIIDSAVETSRPLISASKHDFTVAVPADVVWLEADKMRVAQAISNLLNNAAKYTPAGGKIELAARLIGKEVCIRVTDTGIGISAAALPKIFDLFMQVDGGAARSQNGLGVGLALSQKLAELHDGRIDVESAGEGLGATFTLRLPARVDALKNSIGG